MRLKKLAEQLSGALGIHLTLSRVLRYSERGILPVAKYDDKMIRDYQPADVDRIRTCVILAELGVSLPDVRTFLQDPQAISTDIRKRLAVVEDLLAKAKELTA